jgi:hypothetical protein
MENFKQWLGERDPIMAEAFGIQTMKKGAKWLGKKGLPFALQAGITMADPVGISMHNMGGSNPNAPVSPNKESGTVVDDFFTRQAERRRHKRDSEMQIAAKQNQAQPGASFSKKV